MIHEILNSHRHTLSTLADSCGMDWDEISHSLTFDGRKIKHNRIAKSKEYRGRCFASARLWTAPNGKQYPNITFYTNKHGGITETFNGWLESRNDVGFAIASNWQKDQQKPTVKPVRIDNGDAWRTKKFNETTALFATLPKEIGNHPYLVKKFGENAALIADLPIDLRRGFDKKGDFIIYAFGNYENEITGYQKIYDRNLPNRDDNKDYIIKHEGAKTGSFAVIGDRQCVKFGAWYVEGLATALSVYLADGDGKTTLSNAEKLPVVICMDAPNLSPVVTAHHQDGCENIRLAADNDVGKASCNTGIFTCLQVGRAVGVKSIYVPENNGAKCDFNDTLEFKLIGTGKTLVEFYQQLIRVCPINQVKKYGEQFARVIARNVPFPYSRQNAIDLVVNALAERGVDAKSMPDRIINKSVERRTAKVKKLNTICNKIGLTLHVMPEWTNEQIAESIKDAMRGHIWLDSRGLGAGKTKLLELMRKLLNDCGIAYITHRVSLVKDASGRLDILNYQDVEPREYIQHLGLCVNSMPKYDVAIRFNVLFLDEVRQIIEHCLIGTVENRQAVYDQLAKAVEAADLVIASDADMNDDTVNFLREHANGKKLNWIFTTTPKNKKSIHLVKDFKAIRVKILNQVIADENVVVACTSKAESIRMHTYLLENGIDENAMLLIHADNKGDAKQAEFLANPNAECVKVRCLIHSPTIGSGVSIETEHFKTNFMLDSGNLPANDCLQMTARNRCSDSIFYAFDAPKNFERCTDVEMLIEGENEKHQNYLGKGQFELNELGLMRVNHIANRHEDLNDHANNVLLLADLKGMAIDYSELHHEITAEEQTKQKGLAKRVKEQRATEIIDEIEIDETTAKALGNKFALTQVESNQLNRYLTGVMAGTSELEKDDALNFIDGAMAVVTNHEIVHTNIEDLKAWDRQNHVTKNKLQSKSSLHKIFNAVLDTVKAHPNISNKEAAVICELLTKYAAELAANGFPDYRRKSKYPVRTLGNFLAKIGYEFAEPIKTETARFYRIKTVDDIARYVSNRAALRLAHTTSFL